MPSRSTVTPRRCATFTAAHLPQSQSQSHRRTGARQPASANCLRTRLRFFVFFLFVFLITVLERLRFYRTSRRFVFDIVLTSGAAEHMMTRYRPSTAAASITTPSGTSRESFLRLKLRAAPSWPEVGRHFRLSQTKGHLTKVSKEFSFKNILEICIFTATTKDG